MFQFFFFFFRSGVLNELSALTLEHLTNFHGRCWWLRTFISFSHRFRDTAGAGAADSFPLFIADVPRCRSLLLFRVIVLSRWRVIERRWNDCLQTRRVENYTSTVWRFSSLQTLFKVFNNFSLIAILIALVILPIFIIKSSCTKFQSENGLTLSQPLLNFFYSTTSLQSLTKTEHSACDSQIIMSQENAMIYRSWLPLQFFLFSQRRCGGVSRTNSAPFSVVSLPITYWIFDR